MGKDKQEDDYVLGFNLKMIMCLVFLLFQKTCENKKRPGNKITKCICLFIIEMYVMNVIYLVRKVSLVRLVFVGSLIQ